MNVIVPFLNAGHSPLTSGTVGSFGDVIAGGIIITLPVPAMAAGAPLPAIGMVTGGFIMTSGAALPAIGVGAVTIPPLVPPTPPVPVAGFITCGGPDVIGVAGGVTPVPALPKGSSPDGFPVPFAHAATNSSDATQLA